uniref:protein-tyrosine-phosphatase n=1 Tax=Globodera pallida TaxID=36090 RepID=A0A183BII3_GLOPA
MFFVRLLIACTQGILRSRVTHVKIPFDKALNVYRFPNRQEFRSLEAIGTALSNRPNILTDCFFHISTSGQEAETLLRQRPDGTYLLRESTSCEGEFAVSVKGKNAVIHVRIHRMVYKICCQFLSNYHFQNGRFGIVPKDSFRGLADLLDNYVRMPMVQNDGGVVKLVAAFSTTRFTAATIDDRIDCLLRSQRKPGIKDGFVDEFEGLHREEDAQMFISCKEGRRTENVRKNRYRNVVPFDHTRIKLKSLAENDYINANYIKVPLDVKRYPEFGDFQRDYISTQGCLEETVNDFWQMVWQEESRLIVMVTKEIERGRVKCFRYWPDLEEQKVYGIKRLSVKSLQEQTTGDYVHRLFSLSAAENEDSGPSRLVHHFQILGWEDNESCPNKLANMAQQLFIAGPQCVCDVQKTVRMLREQRATMVQTEAQYRFIYYVISAFMKSYRNILT